MCLRKQYHSFELHDDIYGICSVEPTHNYHSNQFPPESTTTQSIPTGIHSHPFLCTPHIFILINMKLTFCAYQIFYTYKIKTNYLYTKVIWVGIVSIPTSIVAKIKSSTNSYKKIQTYFSYYNLYATFSNFNTMLIV